MASNSQVDRIILAKTAIRRKRTGGRLGNRGPGVSRGIIYNEGVDLLEWITCMIANGSITIPASNSNITEITSSNSSISVTGSTSIDISTETSMIPVTSDITFTDPDGVTGNVTFTAGGDLQSALQWLATQIESTEIQIDGTSGNITYDPLTYKMTVLESSDGGSHEVDFSSLVTSTISAVVPTVTTGNEIFTHQVGSDTPISLYETNTPITEAAGLYSYTSESGDNITWDLSASHVPTTIASADGTVTVVASGTDNQAFDFSVPGAHVTADLASSDNSITIVASGTDNQTFDLTINPANLTTTADITLADPDSTGVTHVFSSGSSLNSALQWLADMIGITEIQISDTAGNISIDPNSLILTIKETSDGSDATVDLSLLKQWSDGVTITGVGTLADPFVAVSVITTLGPAVVDSTTDPMLHTVTIPYTNEDSSNPDITFDIPVGAKVTSIECFDVVVTNQPYDFNHMLGGGTPVDVTNRFITFTADQDIDLSNITLNITSTSGSTSFFPTALYDGIGTGGTQLGTASDNASAGVTEPVILDYSGISLVAGQTVSLAYTSSTSILFFNTIPDTSALVDIYNGGTSEGLDAEIQVEGTFSGTAQYSVVTCSDGTQAAFNKADGTEVDISGGIPNTWALNEGNTVMGPAVVDSSDSENILVTIPYQNEQSNNPDVTFTIPVKDKLYKTKVKCDVVSTNVSAGLWTLDTTNGNVFAQANQVRFGNGAAVSGGVAEYTYTVATPGLHSFDYRLRAYISTDVPGAQLLIEVFDADGTTLLASKEERELLSDPNPDRYGYIEFTAIGATVLIRVTDNTEASTEVGERWIVGSSSQSVNSITEYLEITDEDLTVTNYDLATFTPYTIVGTSQECRTTLTEEEMNNIASTLINNEDFLNSIPGVVTTMGPATVDSTTDVNNIEVTIPYANEDGSNADVVFTIPISASEVEIDWFDIGGNPLTFDPDSATDNPNNAGVLNLANSGVVDEVISNVNGSTYTLKAGEHVQISIIDGTWYVTSGDADSAGTVTSPTANITTTNDISIKSGGAKYLEFPDGTSWGTGWSIREFEDDDTTNGESLTIWTKFDDVSGTLTINNALHGRGSKIIAHNADDDNGNTLTVVLSDGNEFIDGNSRVTSMVLNPGEQICLWKDDSENWVIAGKFTGTNTSVAETITTLGPVAVDSTTDINNIEITIPYANEDGSNADVVFTVPIKDQAHYQKIMCDVVSSTILMGSWTLDATNGPIIAQSTMLRFGLGTNVSGGVAEYTHTVTVPGEQTFNYSMRAFQSGDIDGMNLLVEIFDTDGTTLLTSRVEEDLREDATVATRTSYLSFTPTGNTFLIRVTDVTDSSIEVGERHVFGVFDQTIETSVEYLQVTHADGTIENYDLPGLASYTLTGTSQECKTTDTKSWSKNWCNRTQVSIIPQGWNITGAASETGAGVLRLNEGAAVGDAIVEYTYNVVEGSTDHIFSYDTSFIGSGGWTQIWEVEIFDTDGTTLLASHNHTWTPNNGALPAQSLAFTSTGSTALIRITDNTLNAPSGDAVIISMLISSTQDIEFMRLYCKKDNIVTTEDFLLDAVTPYSADGLVIPCEATTSTAGSSSPDVVTVLGPVAVDATTDPENVAVSIAYSNEDGSNPNVDFTIPLRDWDIQNVAADFNIDDGVSSTYWRSTGNVAQQGTLVNAEYVGADRLILSQSTSSNGTTVYTIDDGKKFHDGTSVVDSITLTKGKTVTITKMSGGDWSITSAYPFGEGEGIPMTQVDASTTAQTINLDNSVDVNGDGYKLIDATSGVSFSATGEDVIGDIDHTETGSMLLALPSTKVTEGGLNLIAEQPDNAANTVTWVVAAGSVELRRGTSGGLYNIAAGQTSWSGGNPTGTLWRNDSVTAATTLSNAYNGQIGDVITTSAYDNAYITDTSTGTEYGPFTFTAWQQGGGGGFAVSDQTTTPDVHSPAWEIVDPRPEVRIANTTGARQRELLGIYTRVNATGPPSGGEFGSAGNSTLTVGKFDNGFGGQSNHNAGLDQDFFFAPILMSRVIIRSWTDVVWNGQVEVTVSNVDGATQSIAHNISNVISEQNYDFAPQIVDKINIKVLTGGWRSRGVTHQLVAPLIGGTGTFSTGYYEGAHDVITIVNIHNTLPLFVDGIEGNPTFEVPPGSNSTASRVNDLWYIDLNKDGNPIPSEYQHISIDGDWAIEDFYAYGSQNVGMLTLSNSLGLAGGTPITINYGSLNNPFVLQLSDGESATFVINGVSGWLPLAPVIPVAPTTDGTYTLQLTVTGGVPSYSWV